MRTSTAATRRFVGMRNRFTGAFDQECTISTPTQVSNNAGGWLDGTPTVQTKVRCEVRFPSANPSEQLNQAATTTLSRAEVRLPVGTAVSIKSTITVGGNVFEVQGHDSGRSFASEILCDCLRVGDGTTTP